ncbi:MmgE/PrpD family protein [Thioalkalivibrio paradoxus]|uniref:2-methylcitrate dehydratase n=1 Tax=Thioalkalivibrio paradoxus ARh 1 TaxID=713585 RepID=W0DNC0_9GAMM|nr:MmgE/PrpD family protein [Thioalkalivibrio paradoxus]AHE99956.1 hypothetical protein THITH_04910 [Thioalkalivibrio paradoxus ARh 1]
MDQPTRNLAEFAVSLDYGALTQSAIDSTVRHVVDTIGCAIGALDAKPAAIARSIAALSGGTPGSTVIGLEQPTTPEYAAFANAVMVRYLDFNDTGIGGHPSDMIPATLAVAEPRLSSGSDVLLATFIQYEVVAALRRGGFHRLRKRHVDQVQSVIGSAIGAGRILGLNTTEMANAISLALTPNIPLRVVRTGVISDWKGCATAHGAMMGVFAARLAREGLTGPPEPFNGIAGLCELVGLPAFEVGGVGRAYNGLSAIEATGFKPYPSEYSSQGPIALLLDLRAQLTVDRVTAITIALHWGGWHEIGGGQGDHVEKWHPTTRESADHSLPYLAAVALIDGAVSLESFSEQRIGDPQIRALMQKIRVVEDPGLTRAHAGELPSWPSRVEIVLDDGRRLERSCARPKGHPLNPLMDQELESKFIELCEPRMAMSRIRQLLDTLWSLAALDDIRSLTHQLRTI